MLHHDEQSAEHDLPAAQTRIKTEELAKAVAALEARRQRETRLREDTLPIGDAVQELGLEATPEEILAEVQQQRASQRATRTLRMRRKAGFLTATAITLSLIGINIHVFPNASGAQDRPVNTATLSSLEAQILVRQDTPRGSLIRTLTEIPDGQTTFCSPDAVYHASIIGGSPYADKEANKINEQSLPEMTWPVVKYQGRLYLRGWTSVPMSSSAAKLSILNVFNSRDAPALGTKPVQITLKLTPYTWADGIVYEHPRGSRLEKFTFAHLHLDQHAWEKW